MLRRIRVAPVLLLLLFLTACPATVPTTPTTTTQIMLSQTAAEGILYDARVALNKGLIKQALYDQIKAGYNLWSIAQNAAIDARVAYLKSPTQTTQTALDAAMNALQANASNLVTAAGQAGITIKQ